MSSGGSRISYVRSFHKDKLGPLWQKNDNGQVKAVQQVQQVKSDEDLFSDNENKSKGIYSNDHGVHTSKTGGTISKSRKVHVVVPIESSPEGQSKLQVGNVNEGQRKKFITYGRSKAGNKYIPKKINAGL